MAKKQSADSRTPELRPNVVAIPQSRVEQVSAFAPIQKTYSQALDSAYADAAQNVNPPKQGEVYFTRVVAEYLSHPSSNPHDPNNPPVLHVTLETVYYKWLPSRHSQDPMDSVPVAT